MKTALPFTVDHLSPKTLTTQVTEGLRSAIFTGFWKTGAKLPTRSQLASQCGVSDNVVRAAIRDLTT